MNCQELESILTDLARGAVPDAEKREYGLAHVKQCGRCGDRLDAERQLSQELAAWSAQSMEEQAPPATEAGLRAAFRQRHAAPAPSRRWVKYAVAGSIAAGVLLFKLLSPVTAPIEVAKAPAPAPSIPNVVTAARMETPDPAPPLRRPIRRRRLPAARPGPAPEEMGTEFLPVAQGDGWTPLDGGRMLRVSLPRSAMGVFGLPVDPAQSPDRVQADVMLSDDGLLRAIRFVR